MKRSLRAVQALVLALMLFTVCCPSPVPVQAAEQPLAAVYFPNWNVYSDPYGQVKDLPWDKMDCVYHAFWKIAPQNGGYAIVSTDPWADTDAQNPKAHFPQYAQFAARYPQVRILLSIGGWTCSGYFSEMALTEESRASFISSCLETLDQYPFLAGLDLDWEYPGVARKGSGSDEGNPVKGDDKTHYTLLLKELRAALDAQFGPGKKQLTVCAAAPVNTLKKQDYASLFPFVDRINLMTYDMTGSYNARTGHHTALYGNPSADTAVKYLLKQGVPASKIAIGSPLYGYGWKMSASGKKIVGAGATGLSGVSLLWKELASLEAQAVPEGTPGWHMGLDEGAQAAYLWNDDPASRHYLYFYTYESAHSLDAKLQYIRDNGLAGIIVWQSGGDDAAQGWPMMQQMHDGLHP